MPQAKTMYWAESPEDLRKQIGDRKLKSLGTYSAYSECPCMPGEDTYSVSSFNWRVVHDDIKREAERRGADVILSIANNSQGSAYLSEDKTVEFLAFAE